MAGITSQAVAQRFVINVAVAFAPAVVFGLLLGKVIKEYLFHPVPVAAAFVLGGVVILWAEARHHRLYGERDLLGQRHARVETVDDMTPLDALKVGLMQCIALIPGTSRSGATIIGAMILGLSRKAATEFSFYLAIPTLIGAGAYSVWKQRESFVAADAPVFAVGLFFAFVSAWLCIRWLIRYISTHDFTVFGWYRIAFGGSDPDHRVARLGRLDALMDVAEPRTARAPPRCGAVNRQRGVIAYGVLVLGWPVFVVMALFWFENVVIGGMNVLRMLVSGMRIGGAGVLGALFDRSILHGALRTLHCGTRRVRRHAVRTARHGA